MENYQQKRMKAFVLPEPVYRQALWAVKDLRRMREKLKMLEESIDQLQSPVVRETKGYLSYMARDRTGNIATNVTTLANRIAAIEDALQNVPEDYRKGIVGKLVYNQPFGDEAHPNTWKKWQQVYIYYVAKNLNLI